MVLPRQIIHTFSDLNEKHEVLGSQKGGLGVIVWKGLSALSVEWKRIAKAEHSRA